MTSLYRMFSLSENVCNKLHVQIAGIAVPEMLYFLTHYCSIFNELNVLLEIIQYLRAAYINNQRKRMMSLINTWSTLQFDIPMWELCMLVFTCFWFFFYLFKTRINWYVYSKEVNDLFSWYLIIKIFSISTIIFLQHFM